MSHDTNVNKACSTATTKVVFSNNKSRVIVLMVDAKTRILSLSRKRRLISAPACQSDRCLWRFTEGLATVNAGLKESAIKHCIGRRSVIRNNHPSRHCKATHGRLRPTQGSKHWVSSNCFQRGRYSVPVIQLPLPLALLSRFLTVHTHFLA